MLSDTSLCSISTVNPYRYRSYYFDNDISLYYLQSRYYDPVVGRFINGDEITNIGLGETLVCYNCFEYSENNPINMIDESGMAAINIICAAIGAIVGWFFGDWFAKSIGYSSGWKYWAIRTGVVIGGAIIGWFAGALVTKLIATYLKANPSTVFKLFDKLGAKTFVKSMEFLGINPFTLATDSSKFIALARLLNSKLIILPYSWAIKIYELAKRFGFEISLDSPHNGYTWHIHLFGGHGELNNCHIQIFKDAWDFLMKLIGKS
ncbi:MAG: RHS repeat-associated core domain-containing protein [Clostridia bacterium]|nr:RHS repeat-associated core domain-containing protein [Clostridia bacterium]